MENNLVTSRNLNNLEIGLKWKANYHGTTTKLWENLETRDLSKELVGPTGVGNCCTVSDLEMTWKIRGDMEG